MRNRIAGIALATAVAACAFTVKPVAAQPNARVTAMPFAFVLRYRNEYELDRLVLAQGDPRSPAFHHFLTPDAFRARFAPSDDAAARVARFLANAGFAVGALRANGAVLEAEASEAVAARFFGLRFESRALPDGAIAHIATNVATLPPALRADVADVVGTTDRQPAMRPEEAATASVPSASAPRPLATNGAPPLDAPNGSYGPWATIDGYGLRAHPGIDGSGVTVASVESATLSEADLNTYLGYFQIPRSGPPTTIVPIDGGCKPHAFACSQVYTASADLQQLVANAPGVTAEIDEMSTYGSNVRLTHAYESLLDRNNAAIVLTPSTWTYCENGDPHTARAFNRLFEQGAALGITFLVTDEMGGECLAQPPSGAAPADSPYVTAVGSTVLQLNTRGGYGAESAWIWSGGGVSSLFPAPPYQRGVRNADPQARNLPDLAIAFTVGVEQPAIVLHGRWNTDVYYNDNLGVLGALLAEAVQYEGSRQGLLNVRLYAALAAGERHAYRSAFNDVTFGCDQQLNFCSKSGYDFVTGIGSLRGLALWENS